MFSLSEILSDEIRGGATGVGGGIGGGVLGLLLKLYPALGYLRCGGRLQLNMGGTGRRRRWVGGGG